MAPTVAPEAIAGSQARFRDSVPYLSRSGATMSEHLRFEESTIGCAEGVVRTTEWTALQRGCHRKAVRTQPRQPDIQQIDYRCVISKSEYYSLLLAPSMGSLRSTSRHASTAGLGCQRASRVALISRGSRTSRSMVENRARNVFVFA